VRFDSYDPGTQGFYDELFADKNQPRPESQALIDRIHSLPQGELLPPLTSMAKKRGRIGFSPLM
jgi:hypothetical protein